MKNGGFWFYSEISIILPLKEISMPKKVTLKSGEVVITYDHDEFIKATDVYIYEQAEILRKEIRAARAKHEKNIREQNICVV